MASITPGQLRPSISVGDLVRLENGIEGGAAGAVVVPQVDLHPAVTGCMPGACDSRRVLLLIEVGGARLLARLDEGGFVHYYGYGSEGTMKDTVPLVVDSGLRALYRAGNPYPSARS